MYEDFDFQNEQYYCANEEFDSMQDRDQFLFDQIGDINFNESNFRSTQQNQSTKSLEPNNEHKDNNNFHEEKQVQIKENHIEHITYDNCKNTIIETKPTSKKIFKKNFSKMPDFNNLNLKKERRNYSVYKTPDFGQNKIYEYLYKITGACLTQNELIFLRKTIFRDAMPDIVRDEQRSKVKNIQRFDLCQDKIIPILQNPINRTFIQKYVMSRRKQYERYDMIENYYNNLK